MRCSHRSLFPYLCARAVNNISVATNQVSDAVLLSWCYAEVWTWSVPWQRSTFFSADSVVQTLLMALVTQEGWASEATGRSGLRWGRHRTHEQSSFAAETKLFVVSLAAAKSVTWFIERQLAERLNSVRHNVIRGRTHKNEVCISATYEGISKSFRTESIMKYKLTFGITRCCPLQRVMAAKLTRLTHKIAMRLLLVSESCNIAVLAPGV